MAAAARIGVFLLLCVAVVASQHAYDGARIRFALPETPPSAALIKAFDLGLDAAAASFLWLTVRVELPFLPLGLEHFLNNLATVNQIDPRFSEPYAFTVLVLPSTSVRADRARAAIAVGERGLAAADPDWRIPFYMGAIYQLELDDHQNAARYFDLAGTTPGVPDIIRRFAVNYGIQPDSLANTKAAWAVIYETSPDPAVRDRAAAHIAHVEIIQYLDEAAQAFYRRHHAYPQSLDDVVREGFVSGIPKDPLGFEFQMYPNGVVGIAP